MEILSLVKNCLDVFRRYHEASAKAKSRVLELLRGLSSELLSKINILIFASVLNVIAKSLFSHVRLVTETYCLSENSFLPSIRITTFFPAFGGWVALAQFLVC